jgi:Na+-driven multidrug efflux pump
MTLGVPTFVRQVLGSVSFGILNNAAGSYGDSAIAAISVTFRVFMLLLMALIGLAQGLQPLVGYNYGAKRFGRVRDTVRLVLRTAAGIGLVAGLTGYLFAPGIIRVFTPQDAEVIRMGTLAMRYMAVAVVPVALVIMFGGLFQALGDGRSALLLAAGQQGLFLIPLVLILPRFLGLNGVFLAQPAGFVFAFLIGLLLLRRSWARMQAEEDVVAAAGPTATGDASPEFG